MKRLILFLLIGQFFTCGLTSAQKPITGTKSDTRQNQLSLKSWWPQDYEVSRNDVAGKLILSTPYYTIEHDLKKGGAIDKISLTHGKVPNLILQPLETSIRLKIENDSLLVDSYVHPETRMEDSFSDINDQSSSVEQKKDGKSVIVTVESQLLDNKGKSSGVIVKSVYTYRWGYIKIHKEISALPKAVRVHNISILSTLLDPSLTDYGIRPNVFEDMNSSPFSLGEMRQWGKIRPGTHLDLPFKTRYIPRYFVLANPGIEGIEWFMADDFSQWNYQVTETPGTGYCEFKPAMDPLGIAVSIMPLNLSTWGDLSWGGWVTLDGIWTFDYFISFPLLEGHANKPWLNMAYGPNRGNWVTEEQIKKNAENGITTMHLHNDGGKWDGLFWRDGSYPPYPSDVMKKMDTTIAIMHKYGIKTVPYFSNHELHPSTEAFALKAEEWGRKPDDQGNLLPFSEFGSLMCFKSGWLNYLKFTVNRVLTNHKFDGVYYDWNVGLYCNNPLHVGKTTTGISPEKGLGAFAYSPTGHWDIEGLLELMEWTRQRVGPDGVVICHNTLVPMFATENFATYIVGMEWSYGTLLASIPKPEDLPLEWNFAGARSRGVIGYGTIAPGAPKRLSQLHAITTLMTSVAPWSATQEALDLYKILNPLGDIEQYKFEDWRNKAIKLNDLECLTAVYSKPGETYVLLANLDKNNKKVRLGIDPKNLPIPLDKITSACIVDKDGAVVSLQSAIITGGNQEVTIPAGDVILIRIK